MSRFPSDGGRRARTRVSSNLRITRREMLATSAAAVGTLEASRLYAGGGTLGERLRKDVRDLTDNEVRKYREAVRRMKMKGPDVPQWSGTNLTMPASSGQDKQGYAFQALVHTLHCPHGNWWFLPWHRVYLFYFEDALRDLAADFMPDVPLTIPYWNWTAQRGVPAIFADPMNNPLFDARRHPIPLRDEDVGSDVIKDTVENVHTFEGFGSSASCTKSANAGISPFEGGPHGMVHVRIGWHRNPPAFRPWGDLRVPPTAAFDPLFWSHHANIDRLWDVWLASDPSHRNPAFDQPCASGNDRTWGNMSFEEFVAGDGSAMSRTVQEFLEDPALIAVQYVPKESAIAAAQPIRSGPMPQAERRDDKREVETVPANMQLRLGEPFTLSIALTAALKKRLKSVVEDKKRTALFRVRDIKVKEDEGISLEVRAYLNKEDVTVETDTKDPHSLGYFTFFGAGHDHREPKKREPREAAGHAEGFTALLNLAPALRRLKEDEVFGDRKALNITLLLQPVDPKVLELPAAAEPVALPFAGGQLELP